MSITEQDALHNQFIQGFTRTKYRKGQQLTLRCGSVIRISDVQPTGYISWSKHKGCFGRMIPAIVNDCDIYQYDRVSGTCAPSGQTTESGLEEMQLAARAQHSEIKPLVSMLNNWI